MPLTFHVYGFIIGLSMLLGWWLVEFQLRTHKVSIGHLEVLISVVGVSGVLGARAWHVLTDFSVYQSNLFQVITIWDGGLSILGAVAGGLLGLIVCLQLKIISRSQVRAFLDAVALSLPLAQAMGRWGNYVNQELYGLPSTLPWAIYIDSTHRLPGYETISSYHPLFLYESSLLILFALLLWGWDQYRLRSGRSEFGSGKYFLLYLVCYTVIRFALDFLRIDKRMFLNTSLGVNQVALLTILSGCVVLIFFKAKKS